MVGYGSMAPPPPPTGQTHDRQVPDYRTRLDAERDQAQWCCSSCNLLNWPSRCRCRECKTRRTGLDPREWALQEGGTASPPRRHRRRESERRRTSSPPSPLSVGRLPSQDGRSADASGSPLGDKHATAVREALAAFKLAQAPEAVLVPLQTELSRLEAAARVARPIGQRLDAARSAMRKSEARTAAAASALAAATEKNNKAMEEQTACAVELASLEEELRASAKQDGQADDLAEAVEATLRNPTAAYSHATLQAAFARYAENKKDKDKDKKDKKAPSPAQGAPEAAKVARSPGTKRQPAQPMLPSDARGVASEARASLTLALTDATAMEEDGQGGEMREEDAASAKKLRQDGGLGPSAP